LAPAPRAPTAPPRLSSRAAIVGLLVLAMLLAYAYPVRVYLNQQAEIAAIEAAQAAQRKHIAELMVERAKWDDDEYVKAQARKRLHFVLPGEKVYVIVDDPAGAAADAGHDQPPLPTGQWYEQVWDSLSGTPETGQ
jgi:cell division protein FtsB